MGWPCFVYMMEMNVPVPDHNHMVKVGISEKPDRRLSQIRTGSPFQIEIIDLWKLPSREDAAWIESNFHREFQKERQPGEWFIIHQCGAADALLMLLGKCWTERRAGQDEWLNNWLTHAGVNEQDTRDYVIGEIAA